MRTELAGGKTQRVLLQARDDEVGDCAGLESGSGGHVWVWGWCAMRRARAYAMPPSVGRLVVALWLVMMRITRMLW